MITYGLYVILWLVLVAVILMVFKGSSQDKYTECDDCSSGEHCKGCEHNGKS